MRSRPGQRFVGAHLVLAGASPVGERLRRQPLDRGMLAIADCNQRRRRRADRVQMKRAHILDVHRRQRRFAADRGMAVRMRAVEQLQERAIGDGPRHVAQLREPMQPQLTHAGEIVLADRGAHHDVRQQLECALREAAEDRDARHRRIRSDVGVELRAQPRQRFMHLDGGAIAAAFVEHVGGDGGQPFLPMGIGRGAAANEKRERHQRHLRVMDGPDPHAVGQRRLLDGGERKGAGRARLGKLRAIGLFDAAHAHETTASSEPGAANAVRPCGTMLSVTRCEGSRYRLATSCSDDFVTSW